MLLSPVGHGPVIRAEKDGAGRTNSAAWGLVQFLYAHDIFTGGQLAHLFDRTFNPANVAISIINIALVFCRGVYYINPVPALIFSRVAPVGSRQLAYF